jgi:hypothetical protein
MSKKLLKKKDRISKTGPVGRIAKDLSKTEGIKEGEIQRRKASGECLRCA